MPHKIGNTSSGWILQDFQQMCVSRVHLETKPSWCSTSLWKKEDVMLTAVTVSTYEDQRNAGFSKLSQVHGINSWICTTFLNKQSMAAHRSVFVLIFIFPCPYTCCWMKNLLYISVRCPFGRTWSIKADTESRSVWRLHKSMAASLGNKQKWYFISYPIMRVEAMLS